MNTMIGHNAGTPLHQLQSAVAGLGLALQDARVLHKNTREQMIRVARYLVMVDEAAADNEAVADSEIKQAGVVQPVDLISNEAERGAARWLAHGGVWYGVDTNSKRIRKNPNDINDLSSGDLNVLEARFLSNKKFIKITNYRGFRRAITGECVAEIRAALDEKDGAPDITEVRNTYSDIFFKADTVDGWIKEEEAKRTGTHRAIQELKKACALVVDKAKSSPEELERLAEMLKSELAEVRLLAAQQRADKEAKVTAPRLTPDQKRIIGRSLQNAAENPAEEVSDDDF